MEDAVIRRLRRKAISNQLVVVVGDSMNTNQDSLKYIAADLIKMYKLNIPIGNEFEAFKVWNKIIDEVEKKGHRADAINYVKNRISNIGNKEILRKIALLPISNFIDLTINRCLLKAITNVQKVPVLHDFKTQSLGTWKQTNPENPNIFFCFMELEGSTPWTNLHEQILIHPQNRIQIENMMEMVSDKDLLLLDFSSYEAEFILHLNCLVSSASKIVNTRDIDKSPYYWSKRGVIISDISVEEIIQYLLPHVDNKYSFWDRTIPRRKIIEITREREYDSFISYFSGDKLFAKQLDNDLSIRGLHIWRDENEIDIGESFTDKVQEGLKKSYSFIIVLSPEALGRPWVKEELRAAYNLRLAEDMKILPVLYKDCEIPLFLSDYRYADFREQKHYNEQLLLLEKSILNAVKRTRRKK